ncbi:Hypothetical protein D9617_13g098990 [Elsinoe fawcettii]|nr:Hypothetical protein D9617_13g098990 [Elsinoe fawcettii]
MTSHSIPARAGPLNSIREVPGPILNTVASPSPPPPDSSDDLVSLSKTTSPVSPILPIQRPSDDDIPKATRQSSIRRQSDPERANKTAATTAAGRQSLNQDSKPSRKTSIRKKHGSMFSFFSSRDQSIVSTDENIESRKSSFSAKGAGPVSAKTPPSSFKPNSKWDAFPRSSKDKSKSGSDRRDSGWSSSRRWSSNPSSRNSLSAPKTHISIEGGSPFASSNVLPDDDRRTEFPFDKRSMGMTNSTSSPTSPRPSSNLIHSTSNPSQPAQRRPVSPISDRDTALPLIPSLNDQIAPPSPHKSVSPAQSFVSARANTKPSTTDLNAKSPLTSQVPMIDDEHLLRQESSVSSLSPVVPPAAKSDQIENQDPPSPVKQQAVHAQQPKRPARPFDDDEELYAKPGDSPMRQDFAFRQSLNASQLPQVPSPPAPTIEGSPKRDSPLQTEETRRDSKRESKRIPSDHDDAKWVSGLDEVTVASSSLDTKPLGRRASLNNSPATAPTLRFSQASSVLEQPVRNLHSAHSRSPSLQASPTVHLSPAPEQYRRSLHSERSRSNSGSRSRSTTPPQGPRNATLRAPEPVVQGSAHSRQHSGNSMASYMNSSQMSDSPHQVAEASVVQIQPTSASPIEVQPSSARQSRQSFDTTVLQHNPRQNLVNATSKHHQRQSLDVYRPQQQVYAEDQPGRSRASSDEQRARHARNFSKPFNYRTNATPNPLTTTYVADDAYVPRSKFARGRLAPKQMAAGSTIAEDNTPTSTVGADDLPASTHANGHKRLPSVEVTTSPDLLPTVNTSSSSLPNPPSASTTGESYATAQQSATEHNGFEEESPSTRETSLDVPHPEQHEPRLHYRLSARDITIVNDDLMGNKVTETSKNYAQSVGFWETAARSAEEAQKRHDTGMDCRLAGPFDPSSPIF